MLSKFHILKTKGKDINLKIVFYLHIILRQANIFILQNLKNVVLIVFFSITP